jgi:5-(carboxyamino)imidazole ribonucleotide synthase
MNGHRTLLILGGGQLSRFLARSALALKGPEQIARLIVVAESEASSVVMGLGRASDSRTEFIFGDPRAKASLLAARELATRGRAGDSERVEVIFENEWVNVRDLEEVFSSTDFNFSPSRAALEILQRKDRQKELCAQLGVPTSPFAIWNTERESAEQFTDSAFARFPSGVVLKWGSEGYDGKGTLLLPDGEPPSRAKATEFCEVARSRGLPIFAEARVAFTEELSLVGVRDRSGAANVYPLVVSVQSGGICQDCYGPATHFGIPAEIETRAFRAWEAIAEKLDYVGTLAIEFFHVPGVASPLLVNEIAPRVHNTGHHSLESFGVSQFDGHVRAAFDLPIPPLRAQAQSSVFGMRNVIGLYAERGGEKGLAQLERHPYYHDYEKSPPLPGRKMGHVTFLASDVGALSDQMKEFTWLKINP